MMKDAANFRNILLLQLGDIGDVVLTSPTILALRQTCPQARISIMVRKPFGSLLQADPSLHEVVESANHRGVSLPVLREYLGFAQRLRRARYDLVIDLRTSDRGAIYSFLTGAQERLGRQADHSSWRKLCFTRLLPDPLYAALPVHPGADQSLRIVRAIGIDTDDAVPRLHVAPEDREAALKLLAACGLSPGRKWVSINPCSRWKYKEWGYEKWGEVIDLLWQDHGIPAVLIGSPEDAAAAAQIVSGRDDHAFNLTGKTTLGQLSALLAMSTLHLGVDSAAPHIAAAVGIPTLTIFGPGNWRSWTIADDLHRVVTSALPCVPCNRKGCDDSWKSQCLDEMEAGRVYAVAGEILSIIDRDPNAGAPENIA